MELRISNGGLLWNPGIKNYSKVRKVSGLFVNINNSRETVHLFYQVASGLA